MGPELLLAVKLSQAEGTVTRVCGGVSTSCDRKPFLQNSGCSLTVLVTPLLGGHRTCPVGHTCLRVLVSIFTSINEDVFILGSIPIPRASPFYPYYLGGKVILKPNSETPAQDFVRILAFHLYGNDYSHHQKPRG